jgi:hypothetical protein
VTGSQPIDIARVLLAPQRCRWGQAACSQAACKYHQRSAPQSLFVTGELPIPRFGMDNRPPADSGNVRTDCVRHHRRWSSPRSPRRTPARVAPSQKPSVRDATLANQPHVAATTRRVAARARRPERKIPPPPLVSVAARNTKPVLEASFNVTAPLTSQRGCMVRDPDRLTKPVWARRDDGVTAACRSRWGIAGRLCAPRDPAIGS